MAARKSPAKKKKTTRKAAKKTTSTAAKRKAPAKRKVAKKTTVARKVSACKEPMTKSAIIRTIAENTELKKADVTAIFEELSHLIECHIGPKNAVGHFTIPGLMKVQRIQKPAKKARKGINPFTGEETTFKAKPAHNVVKVRPLKKLKDMAGKK